ncbi:hypothetical protein BKA65DRAFT_592216 [Rhexocercosporidium sp. MPI-PUGE-AT-0058]|nr:hypothetical protein BKA65DRAFT_592216 [Rhexocercosporidium sp. MPI-PUGE-AT-0058]
MCTETTTIYSNCNAVRIHLKVCASHVDHTRKQLDNAICPDFRKASRYVTNTTRCNCKLDAEPSAVSGRRSARIGCERAASKGYGENGLTWSFEKGPDLKLKKKKDRARERERAVKEEKEVKVKMEEVETGNDERRSWAGADKAAGAAGWGGSMGRSSSSGKAEDSIRRNQMMKAQGQDHQQAKKVKLESSPIIEANFEQFPYPQQLYDDLEME